MRWLRLDISWDDSPWLYELPSESQLAWIKLLCHVKREGIGGKCKSLSLAIAAKKWGICEDAVTRMFQAAIEDEALNIDEGTWTVCNWAHFQESDATRNTRQRRFKEKKREVTAGNGVTTVSNAPACRVTETETKTEVIPSCQLGSESGDGGVGEEGSEMVARLAAKSKLRLAVERLVEETEDDDDDASGGDSLSEKRGNDFRKIGDFRNGGNSRVSSTLREMDERDELERQRAALRRA